MTDDCLYAGEVDKGPITPTPRWVAIVLSLALLTLLAVVAIGARRIPSVSGDSQIPLDPRTIGQIVTYVVWALMAAAVIWLMLPGGGRVRRKVKPKRGSWVATTLVLIALLIVFMQLGKLSPNPTAQEEETTTQTQPEIRDTTPRNNSRRLGHDAPDRSWHGGCHGRCPRSDWPNTRG